MHKWFLSFVFVFLFFLANQRIVFAGCAGSQSCYDYVCSVGGIECQTLGTKNCAQGYGNCERRLRWTEGCNTLTCYIYTNACITVPYCYGESSISSCEEITGSCYQTAVCGDGTCSAGESCSSCSSDCGACSPFCGNGTCNSGETCASCPSDCTTGCGSTCSGSCMPAAANCGSYGMDPVSGGSCSGGQLCCKNKGDSGSDPNCCSDVGWRNANAGGNCDIQSEWDAGWYAYRRGECCSTGCVTNCGTLKPGSCGVDDGNGAYCPNTDNGAPPAPVLTPANNGIVTLSATNTVTVSWTRPARADQYDYQIYPQGTSCASPYAYCGRQATRTFVFTPNQNGGNLYTLRVQPINFTCGSQFGAWAQSNFTIYSNVHTEFFLDDAGAANQVGFQCILPGALSNSAGTGAVIGATGNSQSYNGVISGTSANISVPYDMSGQYAVTLTPGTFGAGQTYFCTCPQNCQYNGGITSPHAGLNFFLSSVDTTHSGWWQSQNGLVYAGKASGFAVTSAIPITTCTGTCIPSISTRDTGNLSDSAGVVVTGGGTVDSSEETGSQTGYVTQRDTQAFALGSSLERLQENYDYFYRQYSMGSTPTDDFASTAADALKPSQAPANTRAYYHNGNLTIQHGWTVNDGESMVVFVNGDLTISDTANVEGLIDVASGGYLAFIVSGNITIDSSVGNTTLTDTSSNIEGVYITNGSITTASKGTGGGGDERFIAEGTFVAWNGFDLNRDYSDGGSRKAENNTKPVETFIYRPDFLTNTPETMKSSNILWQETL